MFYLYKACAVPYTTFKWHCYYLKDPNLDKEMSAMSDQSKTGLFQEANRTSENADAMYLILSLLICYDSEIMENTWEVIVLVCNYNKMLQ